MRTPVERRLSAAASDGQGSSSGASNSSGTGSTVHTGGKEGGGKKVGGKEQLVGADAITVEGRRISNGQRAVVCELSGPEDIFEPARPDPAPIRLPIRLPVCRWASSASMRVL